MTTTTSTGEMRQIVDRAFETVMTRDLPGFLALFTEDGELIDPHYPVQHMRGKAAISEGITWAFGGMKSMGFKVEKYFPGEDGQSAAVEVATAHVLKTGKQLNFPQVFVFEFKDGLITRLQAYEPYGPGGMVGAFLKLNRVIKKFKK
jgi:ketosteroid isomerase-like protein